MMKEYTVKYYLNGYEYASVVMAASSNAALLWAEAIGGYDAVILKELELPKEWYL